MALARNLGALWGVLGFIFLLGYAIFRLSGVFINALEHEWQTVQWVLLAVVAVFMAYSEGYKGFQRSYSPRLAARARYLARSGTAIEIALAPLFCMSFFNAPKRRVIVSLSLFVMIVLMVSAFRLIPQPWRGILDAGVVIGLSWGLISTLYFCTRVFLLQDESITSEAPVSE